MGNIVGIQVGTDGVVSALFDNSQVRKIALRGGRQAGLELRRPWKATSGSNAYQAPPRSPG